MAYLTSLRAVAEVDVADFRAHLSRPQLLRLGRKRPELRASRTASCSHLIAYWVEVEPLGALLGYAIDGGELLHPSLKHRLRPPTYHAPKAARELSAQLNQAWNSATHLAPPEEGGWYAEQIGHVLALFSWATEHGEGVVTSLN